jgi:UDP-N-acetylglucosamine 2-epimerase (non-hydrolysing)
MGRSKFLLVFGTRPEAIKMAPIVKELLKYPEHFETKVCLTGQHRQMLDKVMEFFRITSDFDLNIMKPGQSLFDITTECLMGMEKVLDQYQPDVVFVQGDTTTAFACALAAHYKKIKVAHIEAGLRTGDKYSPFPEEMNRIMAGHLADFHFAPTEGARRNLINEGITKNVEVVSNTVIDALLLGLETIQSTGDLVYRDFFRNVCFDKKIILVTGHRRESFGMGLENICHALLKIANMNPDVEMVYPVHLNPNVREPVIRILQGHTGIHIMDPLDYPFLIWLMNQSYLVLTDSGGIQEEAPSLGKPVLVMREVTERMEGVEAGTAKLVGTSQELIVKEIQHLLDDPGEYQRMAQAHNPYGDGMASKRIVQFFLNRKD